MMWYRFWKKVHGHLTLETYYEFPESTSQDVIMGYCEDWAYNNSSGHNVGYKYDYEIIEKPPKKWLLNEIEILELSLKLNQQKLKSVKFWVNTYSRKAKIGKIIGKLE